MRKILLTLIAFATVSGPAFGADLPPRAYPPTKAPIFVPPPPYNWSGFYFGGNIGYGFATGNNDITGPAGLSLSGSQDLDGIIGGVQFGYNWQLGPRWVVGFETDFQASGQDKTVTGTCPAATCGVAVTASQKNGLPWFGTTRARLGFAANNWLFYSTVGVVYGEGRSELTVTAGGASASKTISKIRAGLAVGGGIEVGLGPHWTGRVEYLYLDTGDITDTVTVAGFGTVTGTTRLHNNIVRAAFNYRF